MGMGVDVGTVMAKVLACQWQWLQGKVQRVQCAKERCVGWWRAHFEKHHGQ